MPDSLNREVQAYLGYRFSGCGGRGSGRGLLYLAEGASIFETHLAKLWQTCQ
jgi:hypothetical protein